MRILIATDAFPPLCGGSGWSAYELARGLRARGHDVVIVQPRPGQPADAVRTYDALIVREIAARAPDIPYVRNYFKNERLYRRLEKVLREVIRHERIDLVHAQHVLTSPPSIAAAHAERIPVVCTVRDYWPVCYWSDLIHDYRADGLCPGCSPGMMTRCVRPRAGAAWPLALPFIPYMSANLARKRQSLARADAIVAVSSTLAADLRSRAPEIAQTRLEVIPNPVDLALIQATAERATVPPLSSPYAVYVGKLARNKGTLKLLDAVHRADLRWPLIVIGDGPERVAMESAAAASVRDVRFTGWLPREEAWAWLRHASLLVFPSHGPESLSRVLLEAGALGVPIAAMDTGGTRDIVQDEVTGLLARDVDGLGAAIRRLVQDRPLAARLGQAAREFVRASVDAPRVVQRLEALYDDLVRGAPCAS